MLLEKTINLEHDPEIQAMLKHCASATSSIIQKHMMAEKHNGLLRTFANTKYPIPPEQQSKDATSNLNLALILAYLGQDEERLMLKPNYRKYFSDQRLCGRRFYAGFYAGDYDMPWRLLPGQPPVALLSA